MESDDERKAILNQEFVMKVSNLLIYFKSFHT